MPRTSPPRKDKNKVPREKRALPPAAVKEAERVAKVIARAGLASRREIEEWILAGRVAVNGRVLESPALTVTAADAITVDGAPLPERERTRLYLYHKPKGVVTTNKDPEGRTTLFEILPRGLPRLVSVGRLDLNSEGLLLLTNDGGLARVLELPETGWLRRYRVRANGAVDQAKLDTLLRGITVAGVDYGPIEATLDRVQGANAWITVALREGKNREVRNVLGALGLQVSRLIRVSYGPFQLGEIEEGGIEEVRTRVLRDQIGADLAGAAGADFSGPLTEYEVVDEPPPARRIATARIEAARNEAARNESARKAEPAGVRRAPPPARAAAEDDFSEAAPGRRPRLRLKEEHELESRGTVADRKGRTVKVERVVATQERPSGAPARGKGAGLKRAAGPGTGRGFEGGARSAGRDAPRGKAPGRPGGRERAGEESEGFHDRPRGERFGQRPGADPDAPRGGRPGGPSRPSHGDGRRDGPSRGPFDKKHGGRAARPFDDERAGASEAPRPRSHAPRDHGPAADAPRGGAARFPRRTAGTADAAGFSGRPPGRPRPAGEEGPPRPRTGRMGAGESASAGRQARDPGYSREAKRFADADSRSGKPGGFKGRGKDGGTEGSKGGFMAEGRGPSRGGKSGSAGKPRYGAEESRGGFGGMGEKGRGSRPGGKGGRPPHGGAPGGKRPGGARPSGLRPDGPRSGGPRGKR